MNEIDDRLFKSLAEAIAKEVVLAMMKTFRFRAGFVEFEAKNEILAALRKASNMDYRIVSAFSRPEKGDKTEWISCRVKAEAKRLLEDFERAARLAKLDINRSDIIRDALMLYFAVAFGDEELIMHLMNRICDISNAIKAWYHRAEKAENTCLEARCHQVTPSDTVSPCHHTSETHRETQLDENIDENRREKDSPEYKEARRLAWEALKLAREEGLSESVYQLLLEAKKRLEPFKDRAAAQFFLEEIERNLKVARRVYGYR